MFNAFLSISDDIKPDTHKLVDELHVFVLLEEFDLS